MKTTEELRHVASVAVFIVGFAALHMGWQHVSNNNVPAEQKQPHPFVRLYRRLTKPVEE